MSTTVDAIEFSIIIISFLLAALTIASGAYLAVNFIKNAQLTKNQSVFHNTPKITKSQSTTSIQTNSPSSIAPHSPNLKQPKVTIKKYFKLTASVTVILNILNTICNALFTVYLLYNPDITTNYIQHESYTFVEISIFCWFISKACLLWFFSGRLYYVFKESMFQLNKKLLIFINILNTIIALLTFIINDWAQYHKTLITAQVAFYIYCILFQIMTFIILYIFSSRLLSFAIQQVTSGMLYAKNPNVDSMNKNNRQSSVKTTQLQTTVNTTKNKKGNSFIEIATRNAVLVFTMSFMVALVTVWFILFYCFFSIKTRFTLSIPIVMTSIDSLITSICVICLFRSGDKLYYTLCGCCDVKVNKMCVYLSNRLMNVNSRKTNIVSNCSESVKEITIKTPEISGVNVDNEHKNKLKLRIIDECCDIVMELPKLRSSVSNKSKSINNKDFSVVLIDDTKQQNKQSIVVQNNEFCLRKLKLRPAHSEPIRSVKDGKKENVTNKINRDTRGLRLNNTHSAKFECVMFDALYL